MILLWNKDRVLLTGKSILSKVSLRKAVQALIVIIILYAAWEYYGFVQFIKGEAYAYHARPNVLDGFLPIAAVVSFKAWIGVGIFDTIHPAGLVIFIAILVTGWIFRRGLCSWICPLGTLSEKLGDLGKRIFGRYLKLPKWLDFILLGIKYAIFFYFFKTLLFMPSDAAAAFMDLPYYVITDVKMFDMFANLSMTGLGIILVLILLSIVIRSFWCRYLCPYGALQGIIGILSPFILVKDSNKCTNCSLCNQACPGRVDVARKKRVVISTECTGCTECVSVCPSRETLRFKLLGVLPVTPGVFSAGFLVVFFGIIFWAKFTGHWQSSATVQDYMSLYTMMTGGGIP